MEISGGLSSFNLYNDAKELEKDCKAVYYSG